MNVTTKFLLNTTKVFGAVLWIAVFYRYGVFEFIGEYIAAVINFNIQYLCYNAY